MKRKKPSFWTQVLVRVWSPGKKNFPLAEVSRIAGILLKAAMERRAQILSRWVLGVSPVVEWLRICLPMPGTWVQALVWEDPTFLRATKPVSHNY